jgi:hypothetical protein
MTMLGGNETIMGDSGDADPKTPVAKQAPVLDEAPDPGGITQKDRGIMSDLAGLKRKEATVADANARTMETRVEYDRQQMEQAFQREQYAAGAMPPAWDADKEKAKRTTGPMESFGSAGMIFAMFASLATKTPLTSALNAGAAVNNAISASDEKAYEHAFAAWKENVNRVQKQFNMEQQLFNDTQHLMSSDITAWRASQIANEARFGNRKAIMLLENGMDKEYLEAKTAQIRAADAMRDSSEKFDLFDTQRRVVSAKMKEYDEQNPNAKPADKMSHRLMVVHDSMAGKFSMQQDAYQSAVEQYSLENGHEPPADWKTKKIREIATAGAAGRGTNAEVADLADQYMKPTDEGGLGLPRAQALERAIEKVKGSKTGVGLITDDRMRAKDTNAIVEEEHAKHPYWKPEDVAAFRAETSRRLKVQGAAPSGNRLDELKGKENQVDMALGIAQKIDALLLKRAAITGLGGIFTRPPEAIADMLGSSQTDRAEFKRLVLEMQELAPRLLLDTKGRPLGSESSRVNGIIAGLAVGDTKANTLRAYKDFEDTLKEIKRGLRERQGTGSEKPKSDSGDRWWDDPAAGKVLH